MANTQGKKGSSSKKQTVKEPREAKKDTSFKPLSFMNGLADEIRHTVFAIIFLVLGIALSSAPFGKAGIFGQTLYGGLNYLFGVGYFTFLG